MSNFCGSKDPVGRSSTSSALMPASATRAAISILWMMPSVSASVFDGPVGTITVRLRISSERAHMSLEYSVRQAALSGWL